MSTRTRNTMNNAIGLKKVDKSSIFLTPVRLYKLNLIVKLGFNHLFELKKSGKDIRFSFKQIKASIMRICIYKVNVIRVAIWKCGGDKALEISVDKLQGCSV